MYGIMKTLRFNVWKLNNSFHCLYYNWNWSLVTVSTCMCREHVHISEVWTDCIIQQTLRDLMDFSWKYFLYWVICLYLSLLNTSPLLVIFLCWISSLYPSLKTYSQYFWKHQSWDTCHEYWWSILPTSLCCETCSQYHFSPPHPTHYIFQDYFNIRIWNIFILNCIKQWDFDIFCLNI